MAFAPFPPPLYLSDGARTEGEMKTAFENWLLATTQTSGHGQCRLRESATQLWLTPLEGRRVLLADRAYELPVGGLTITNAGLVANTPYLVALHDDTVGTVSLKLYGTGAIRVVDPDSGISMVSFDSGATIARNTTVVGIVFTDAAGTFTTGGVCSLYGRALRTQLVDLGSEISGGTGTYGGVLGAVGVGFAGDTVQCHGTLIIQTQPGVGALIRASGMDQTVERNVAIWSLPAATHATFNLRWPVILTADGGRTAELGFAIYSGAPITVKVGTQLSLTSWA